MIRGLTVLGEQKMIRDIAFDLAKKAVLAAIGKRELMFVTEAKINHLAKDRAWEFVELARARLERRGK